MAGSESKRASKTKVKCSGNEFISLKILLKDDLSACLSVPSHSSMIDVMKIDRIFC